MTLQLTNLIKAITSLEKSLQIVEDEKRMMGFDVNTKDTLKSGVIQNFEVAYEQSWKMIKRWLEQNATAIQVDGVTRRELFRLAFENRLINDVDDWMLLHQARNETSHVYDGSVAAEVLEVATQFLSAAKVLLVILQSQK